MKHWKKVLALLLLAGVVCLCVFDWTRVKSDFYPLDRSYIAPNIMAALVQWAIVLIVVALLYPPTRRAIERFATRHVDDLKAHVTAEHAKIHERLDHVHERQDALQSALDSVAPAKPANPPKAVKRAPRAKA